MLVLSLILALNAHARVCEDVRLQPSKRIAAPDGVSYFMRPSAKRTVGFATTNGNRLLNLNDGKTIDVAGTVDPVPTPDGDLIAVPVEVPISRNGGQGFEYRMHFYRESAPGKLELRYIDRSVSQTYQSLGVLKKSPSETSYRMIYQGGKSEIYARDYTYDRRTHELKPGPEPALLCKNGPKDIALPMLSKDGREFSYYDNNARKTYIYEVSGLGGECRKKDEIRAALGKIDFSPDGKRMVFHADGFSDEAYQFEHPLPSFGLGIYLYDRQTKRTTPLHVSRTEDTYYPNFLNNDEIAFVSANRGGNPDERKFFINVASLKGVGKGCVGCFSNEKLIRRASVIGHFYGQICRGQEEFVKGGALMTFTSLNADRCHELVRGLSEGQLLEFARKNFTEQEVAEMGTKDSFLKACEALKGTPPPARTEPLDEPAVQPAR
jgi:hypothetical protein